MTEPEVQDNLLPSIGAIYLLSKKELIERMSKLNINTEGTVNVLRSKFSTYMKEARLRKSAENLFEDLEKVLETKGDEEEKRSSPESENDGSKCVVANPGAATSASTSTHTLPAHPPINEFDSLTREPGVRDWYYPVPNYAPPMFSANAATFTQPPADVERLRGKAPHMFFSRPTVCREVDVMNTVRKWGLRYDGSGSAREFIERLIELNESYKIRNNEILKALSEIFKGPALEWFRINRTAFVSWDEFQKAFLTYFLPTRFINKLEDEIARKSQGPREKAKDFIRSYQYLVHQHPNMRLKDHVDKIYDRLRPEYHLYIRRKDFETLEELSGLAEEYEYIRNENKLNNPAKAPEKPIVASRNFRETASSPDQYDRRTHCWNCKQRGHSKTNCRRPFRMFCSYCGEDGRLSKDCSCHQQNPQASIMEKNPADCHGAYSDRGTN
ncbi:uncharacterized protein LOC129906926 [Episyrphus balteatus]|uniref:uncharacterized protein LOC129906926 n=1 Tax=Episyrphus balteatus TaxID=286459 RepID=UPI0024852155|nr:uncharacterized protein LOC129906926 [Episyrphus balteatus]